MLKLNSGQCIKQHFCRQSSKVVFAELMRFVLSVVKLSSEILKVQESFFKAAVFDCLA